MLPLMGKKKVVQNILGGGDEPEEEMPMESGDSFKAIAGEIMDAIKNSSEEDLANALKAFLAEHEASEE